MDINRRNRTGCTECRRKKAKCDEKKPVCSRCKKYPKFCVYELHVVHSQGSQSRRDKHKRVTRHGGLPSPQSEPPDPAARPEPRPHMVLVNLATFRPTQYPTIRSDRDKFYLHHFIRDTALIYFPCHAETFLSHVLNVAESSPCMFGAVQVASSSHYFRLRGDAASQVASIDATLHTLSSLRRAIGTSQAGDGTLATSLMLATTCLCAGDTATYRQHLYGALRYVREICLPLVMSDGLLSFSIKWLTHLLLMERVSTPSGPLHQGELRIDWDMLAKIMPYQSQIDPTNYLSLDLIRLLDVICDISYPTSVETNKIHVSCTSNTMSLPNAIIESRLINLRNLASSCDAVQASSDLQCAHRLFIDSALLMLYRRAMKLHKDDRCVQKVISGMELTFNEINDHSAVNIPLLWPLLSAGCDAMSLYHRTFFADRMASMEEHGVGNCKIALDFMNKYWAYGGEVRWDTFSKQVGADLILF